MQRADQIACHCIPTDYVRNIEVTYNNEPLFKVVTDISISEDPAIAFGFVPKEGGGDFEVVVTDSEGRRFDERFNPSTTN